MPTWKELDRLRKALILLMVAAVAASLIGCKILNGRQGVEYRGQLLVHSQEGEVTRYTGKVEGQPMTVTVEGERIQVTQGGETATYLIRIDPSAETPNPEWKSYRGTLTGLEITCGDRVLFRGGADLEDGLHFLLNENGALMDFGTAFEKTPGAESEGDTALAAWLVYLWRGPNLVCRGNWQFFGIAALLAFLNIGDIFLADMLFRWRISLWVQDPETVEPSGWELFTRKAGQVFFALLTIGFSVAAVVAIV